MKYCKDCLYYKRFWLNDELSTCTSPNGNPFAVSSTTGKIIKPKDVFCSIAREAWMYGPMCGPEAKWFKPKTPKLRWLKYFLFKK